MEEDRECVAGMKCAYYSTSNKLLLVARHADYGPSKMPLKLAL